MLFWTMSVQGIIPGLCEALNKEISRKEMTHTLALEYSNSCAVRKNKSSKRTGKKEQ